MATAITEQVAEKRCARCKETRPRADFFANPRATSGLSSYCRDCQREYMRERNYGLTSAEFGDLLQEQGAACAICCSEEPGGRGDWHVDHCHETGAVRGLLCANCNIGVGYFGDDAERLNAAAGYIDRFRLAAAA